MVMTTRGIYHNLNESEYAISNSEVALFFSSQFYLGKFLDEYKEERKVFKKRISKAMITKEMNTDFLSDVTLYKLIEKRGFRATLLKPITKNNHINKIKIDEGELTWQELNQLGLAKMTRKNTLDWSEMLVQK